MLKTTLLLIALAGTLFLLLGCSHCGYRDGHNHNRLTNNYQSHTHYQGCGHSGYRGE